MTYTDAHTVSTQGMIDFPSWVKEPTKCKTHTHRIVVSKVDSYRPTRHGARIINETCHNRNKTHKSCGNGRTLIQTEFIR